MKTNSFRGIQGKLILQIALALIPIAFCIYFLKHEGYQLHRSFQAINACKTIINIAGFIGYNCLHYCTWQHV